METVTKIMASYALCLCWKKIGGLWQESNLLCDQYHKLRDVIDKSVGGVGYPTVDEYEAEWDATAFTSPSDDHGLSTPL